MGHIKSYNMYLLWVEERIQQFYNYHNACVKEVVIKLRLDSYRMLE